MTVHQAAKWCLANPALARGRFLTAHLALNNANQQLAMLMGYLDASGTDEQYVRLGIEMITSRLMKAVRALNIEE